MAYNDAITISDNYIKGAANEVKIHLEKYYTAVADLSNSFKVYKNIDAENRRSVISNIMIETLKSNNDFLAVWSTWEPNAMDSLDYKYKNKKEVALLVILLTYITKLMAKYN